MLKLKELIAKLLAFAKTKYYYSGIITSSYTIRVQEVAVRSGVCSLLLAINNGGTNFTNGRISSLGTIAQGYRPARQVIVRASASTGVNNVLNRHATIIVQTNGNIILDNQGNTDVKEVNTTLTYVLGG